MNNSVLRGAITPIGICECPDLSVNERFVLMYLLQLDNKYFEKDGFFASIKSISDSLNISEKTINSSIKRLEDIGYINGKKRGANPKYYTINYEALEQFNESRFCAKDSEEGHTVQEAPSPAPKVKSTAPSQKPSEGKEKVQTVPNPSPSSGQVIETRSNKVLLNGKSVFPKVLEYIGEHHMTVHDVKEFQKILTRDISNISKDDKVFRRRDAMTDIEVDEMIRCFIENGKFINIEYDVNLLKFNYFIESHREILKVAYYKVVDYFEYIISRLEEVGKKYSYDATLNDRRRSAFESESKKAEKKREELDSIKNM